jgi:hypothetical protein
MSKWLERARAYQSRQPAHAAPGAAQLAQLAECNAAKGDLSALSALTARGWEPRKAPDAAAIEERAAIVEEGAGVPREWAEGYARLCLMPPPFGVSVDRWLAVINGVGHFLDQWAGKAHALGWTAAELFGLDPVAPLIRLDRRNHPA